MKEWERGGRDFKEYENGGEGMVQVNGLCPYLYKGRNIDCVDKVREKYQYVYG